MSNKKEPSYEDLSKKYSDEEIAESFVFRSTMTEEEQLEADKEFRNALPLKKNSSNIIGKLIQNERFEDWWESNLITI